MNIYAVIGLQFGDEGKGSFTQHLAILNHNKDKKNLIIRFNGGHQAGHTTVYNITRHVFSSFGSGTLVGEPTFWSKYCTIFPPALFNEYHVLKENGITPKIIFDPLCPVTTPYDVMSNRNTNSKTNHGSVGVGFGATIKRQEDYYKLHYQDLFNRTVTEAKLYGIKSYYEKIYGEINIDEQIDVWLKCIDALITYGVMTPEKLKVHNEYGLPNYDNIIFEGAQGILLDMDFGFFPNVTRSNTTTKNINDIMFDYGISIKPYDKLKVFYMTRCYQTRHGNGFMSNENLIPNLINTKNETNLDTSYQGRFRKSILDLDLIKYAIQCDDNFGDNRKKSIVITCLDQLTDGVISFTKDKKVFTKHIDDFKELLKNEFGYDIFLGTEEGVFDYKGETIKDNRWTKYGYPSGFSRNERVDWSGGEWSGSQGVSGTQGTQGVIEPQVVSFSTKKVNYPKTTHLDNLSKQYKRHNTAPVSKQVSNRGYKKFK